MLLTAWKHTERNRHKDRKKHFLIPQGVARFQYNNKSLNDSKYNSLETT